MTTDNSVIGFSSLFSDKFFILMLVILLNIAEVTVKPKKLMKAMDGYDFSDRRFFTDVSPMSKKIKAVAVSEGKKAPLEKLCKVSKDEYLFLLFFPFSISRFSLFASSKVMASIARLWLEYTKSTVI